MTPSEARTPDLLAIGHVAKDLTQGGYRPGGCVTYAAATCLGLGLRPAVVTSAGPDVDLATALGETPRRVVPADVTTTFRNLYSKGKRRQFLLGRACDLGVEDVPPPWRRARGVLLGPVADEVDPALAKAFPGATVVACLQGWLRTWDDQGRVRPRRWEGRDVLPFVHAAVVSEEDFEDAALEALWARMVPVLIVTMADRGARVHMGGRWHHVPAVPAVERDPTGAGDVFAAAYLVRYCETADPLKAARWAAAVASFAVEGPGTSSLPTRRQVEERLARRPRPATP